MSYAPTATQVAFKAIQTELAGEFLELDDQIEGVIVAALAGENVLSYGSPGVNKSGTAHAVQKRFEGSKYGWWLLNPQMDVAKFEGMFDLGEFQRTSEYVNKIDGTRATIYNTNVLLFDEIDKAPAGIKTPLLTAINEKIGDWGKGPQPLDIVFAMACANRELGPEDEAFADRFPIKLWFDNLKSADNVLALLDSIDTPRAAAVPTTIHIDDVFKAVRHEVPAVTLPRDVKLSLVQLREELIAEGFEPSNRTIYKCGKILKAKAYLEGRDTVVQDDIFVLRHVFWTDRDSKPKVDGIVLKHTGPTTRAALRIMKAVVKAHTELSTALASDSAGDDVSALGGKIMGDIRELRGLLSSARVDADGPNDKLDEVEVAINELHVSVFVNCMHNTETQARQIVKMQGGDRQAVAV